MNVSGMREKLWLLLQLKHYHKAWLFNILFMICLGCSALLSSKLRLLRFGNTVAGSTKFCPKMLIRLLFKETYPNEVHSNNSPELQKCSYIIANWLKSANIIIHTLSDPRRGALNGWIMISFCQEMACLAVDCGFKTLN